VVQQQLPLITGIISFDLNDFFVAEAVSTQMPYLFHIYLICHYKTKLPLDLSTFCQGSQILCCIEVINTVYNWLEYNLLFVARSGGDTNDKEAPDRASKEGQGGGDAKAKKVWREHENRWSHDRYNAEEQAPKSCEELIAVYGYDIRNEEGPPRARRRRRYG
jgi:hypothetical protein